MQSIYFSRTIRFTVLLALCLALGVWPRGAIAACSGAEKCDESFRSIVSVVWSGMRFKAIGKIQDNSSLRYQLIQFKLTGDRIGASVDLPLKEALSPNNLKLRSVRKLISADNDSSFVIGDALSGNSIQVAWVAKLNKKGEILWLKTFEREKGATIFHSGLYDKTRNRIILVGRITKDIDTSGKCQNWSQGYVVSLNSQDGSPDAKEGLDGPTKPGMDNRRAFYDVVVTDNQDEFAVIGFASAPQAEDPGRCQNDIFIGIISSETGSWKVHKSQRTDSGARGEVASSAISISGTNTFVLVGERTSIQQTQAVGIIYKAQIENQKPGETVKDPFSPLSSIDPHLPAKSYKTIVSLGKTRGAFVFGTTFGDNGSLKQGWWQQLSSTLQPVGTPTITASQFGCEIAAAAVSPDGVVLVVGSWNDGAGGSAGWVRVVNNVQSSKFGLEATSVTDAGLRNPWSSSSDIPSVSTSDLSTGVQWNSGAIDADSTRSFRIEISTATGVQFATTCKNGDIDILLIDSQEKPIAFSNYSGTATDYIFTPLSPGSYTAILIGQKKTEECRISVGPGNDLYTITLGELAKLDEEELLTLNTMLSQEGYNPSPEPTIATGLETARALLALRAGASEKVKSLPMSKFIRRLLDQKESSK